jgi:polyisoprenoid-binding protein YceI
MSMRSKISSGVALAAVGAGVLALGLWYFVLKSDAPPPVSLAGAIESVATAAPPASTTDATATSSAAVGADLALETGEGTATEDLAGTWVVVEGDSSFVGYRVDETLAGVGATTAVGRTSDLEGSLEYDGSLITAVEITADLTTLASDKSMRDGQLRTQAIETGVYPTATFVLTSPIEIAGLPAEGEAVTQSVSGELTLHGVTQAVQIEVEGVLQDGQLIVVGSTEIQFADFDIDQPVSMSVVSIEDHGTMEFQLVFSQS